MNKYTWIFIGKLATLFVGIIWTISLIVIGGYYIFTNDFGTTNYAIGWILVAVSGIAMSGK
jgi:hypothetical protein